MSFYFIRQEQVFKSSLILRGEGFTLSKTLKNKATFYSLKEKRVKRQEQNPLFIPVSSLSKEGSLFYSEYFWREERGERREHFFSLNIREPFFSLIEYFVLINIFFYIREENKTLWYSSVWRYISGEGIREGTEPFFCYASQNFNLRFHLWLA